MSRATKDSRKPGVPHSSGKSCWCGGHSSGDMKSNVNNNATKRKKNYREGRLEKARMK